MRDRISSSMDERLLFDTDVGPVLVKPSLWVFECMDGPTEWSPPSGCEPEKSVTHAAKRSGR